LLLLLLFLTPAAARCQPPWLKGKPYAEKCYFSDSLFRIYLTTHRTTLPDSFDRLSRQYLAAGDKELGYLTTYQRLRILIEAYEISDPGLQNSLTDFLDKTSAANLHYLQASAAQLLGKYLWYRKGNHNLGIEYLLSAYNLYSGFSADEFPLKREYLIDLGNVFRYLDREKAIHYLSEAAATKPAKYGNLAGGLYTTLGLCYRELKKYDSSDWCFGIVYNLHDNNWTPIAAGNIGVNYYYEHRYDEAIPLLQEEVNAAFPYGNNIKSAANSLFILSSIWFERGDVDKAEAGAKAALAKAESKPFWPDYLLADRLYTILHNIYSKKGAFQLASFYADSAMMARDTLQAVSNKSNLMKAQERLDYMQHKLEKDRLETERRLQLLIRNSLIAIILMLMVIGVMLIGRQRLLRKKLLAEKKNAELELEAASHELETFRLGAREKNQMLDKFAGELEKMKQKDPEADNTALLTQLEQSIILTDQQWEDFRMLFEKVHKGFFVNLKKKIPDLTQAEIRFLALTKLRLTSKEMSAMLGISANTIRTYRYRLRKKFDLDKDEMVDELLEDL